MKDFEESMFNIFCKCIIYIFFQLTYFLNYLCELNRISCEINLNILITLLQCELEFLQIFFTKLTALLKKLFYKLFY